MCDAPDFGHMTGDARKRHQGFRLAENADNVTIVGNHVHVDDCCGRDGWPDMDDN